MTRKHPHSLPLAALAGIILTLTACGEAGDTPLEPNAVPTEVSFTVAPSVDVLTLPDFTPTGGTSTIQRGPNGVDYQLEAVGLTPGHAATLWFLVFNYPAGCTTGAPCGGDDIVNADARPDMMFAAGRVVGGSGTAMFAGRRSVGDGSGSANGPVGLPAFGLENPEDAIIFLVVHDHGPVDSAFLPSMVKSIDGGCSDAGVPEAGVSSPWNDYAGPPAGAFGVRGSNTCQSIQIAVHAP
ncbi:MAG: hypothetical protein ABFS34_14440 [Gemmatimonadota bacterium]